MQTTLTTDDLYFWKNGEHDRLYELFGVQTNRESDRGSFCRTWAPHAKAVCVVGDFNNWQWNADPLLPQDGGVWQGNIPALTPGGLYKFAIESQAGEIHFKADPFGRMHESAPNTASIATAPCYDWNDDAWLSKRRQNDH